MAENTEKAVEKTGSKAETFKKFLTLEPWFINKFGPKLKPIAKVVYYILSGLLCLMLLSAIVDLFKVGVLAFVIKVALVAIYFIVVRMFAEYLTNK